MAWLPRAAISTTTTTRTAAATVLGARCARLHALPLLLVAAALHTSATTSAPTSAYFPHVALTAGCLSSGAASRRGLYNMSGDEGGEFPVDAIYPGTAVQRLRCVHERVASLSEADLNGPWEAVRRRLLWAGGLRDLTDVLPGRGYTGHAFNDWNHCDLTTMLDEASFNEHHGEVEGIALGNQLGPGVRVASLSELGPGGSWSTCMMGCNRDPPADVAHVQFRSRIAFKLVWVPPAFDRFVLVDDDGELLAKGTPTGGLPSHAQRETNYRAVAGSKYAVATNVPPT